MFRTLFRRKPIRSFSDVGAFREGHLKRSLSAFDLTCLGVGAIVGVGIFVITGTAAAHFAGPSIVLAFMLAMLACILAALCYAEFAALFPVAGSAYNYVYTTLGEFMAWIVGWALVLEYMVAAVLVAIGWSGYFVYILEAIGISLPVWCRAAPGTLPGAVVNLPAVMILLLLTGLLITGIKEGARLTTLLVVVKLGAIVTFLAIGIFHVDADNWTPFMPFGIHGIFAGAAIVFVAYIGFDAISTVAEETKDPQRNLPIGIITSLTICTVLYILVAGVLTGMVPYTELDQPAPVAYALSKIGFRWGSALVSTGAIAGLTSVLIVMLMGQPRVFFAMSRDGLLPGWLSRVHPVRKTPHRVQLACGIVVAFFSAFVDLGTAAELTNIGTLFAFTMVCAGTLVLHYREPGLYRPFRCPGVPVVPTLGMIVCLWLMCSLPAITWMRFVSWFAIGIVVYFLYGRRHSRLTETGQGAQGSV